MPEVILPAVNLSQLLHDDTVLSKYKDIPERYGVAFETNLDLLEMGTWDTLSDGSRVCRISIKTSNAVTLEMKFNKFHLPFGSQLSFYDTTSTLLCPVVTSQSNRVDNRYSSGLLRSSFIIIEYNSPSYVSDEPMLSISKVIHGYKDPEIQIEKVGDCYVDINCPDGSEWQTEKRAVARILLGSGQYCTGTLINNTLQNGKQYLLTANHCYEASTDVENWDFYFNYEASTCDGFVPYIPSVGGSELLARNIASDFCLVEITGTIPTSSHVVFAGWDRSDIASDSVCCIHHPAGSSKKISFEYSTTLSSSWSGTPALSHWMVADYDIGSTEGGSSGCALFNKEHKVMGQLHGGSALCGNDLEDLYGKFSVSWNYGSSASTRLKEWLDPYDCSTESMGSWCPDSSYVSNDIQVYDIVSPETGYCTSNNDFPMVVIRNLGQNTFTNAMLACTVDNGLPSYYNWTGNLSYGQTDTLGFSSLVMTQGQHTIKAYISNAGGIGQLSFNDTLSKVVTGTEGQLIRLDLKGRKYYEDEITWSLKEGNTTLYSGGPYSTPSPYLQLHIMQDFCLEEGCYTFTITDNNCGGTVTGIYYLINVATGDTISYGCNTGTTDVINFCIQLNNPPVANFSSNASEICSGDSVTFINLSYQNPTGFNWTAAGGNPSSSSEENPTITYNIPGSFPVTLVTTNTYGTDTLTVTGYITVHSIPSFTINHMDESNYGASDGSAEAIPVAGSAPYTFLWSNSEEGTSISSLTSGWYYVTMTDANGCLVTDSIFIDTDITTGDESSSPVNQIMVTYDKEYIYILSDKKLISVELLDIQGKLIYCTPVIDHHVEIDISTIESGIYFIRAYTDCDIFNTKILLW